MKRNARLFAVMLGLGVAGGAWAAARPNGAVGPDPENAVRTQKAVGPDAENAVRSHKTVGPSGSLAVKSHKTVGPEFDTGNAVRTQKAVGPEMDVQGSAVRTQKAVGPMWRAVHTDKTVGHDEKRAGNGPLLDLNAGF